MSRLDEIKARAEQVHWTSTSIEQAMARMASSAADVPWLASEVDRLTAERDALQVGRDRDRAKGATAVLNEELRTSEQEARARRAEAEVERLTVEREWFKDRFPCDGGCVDGPEEACSRHGRTPEDLWRIIGEVAAERNALAAQVARVEKLAGQWARLADTAINPDSREWLQACAVTLRECLAGWPKIRDALAGSEADTSEQEAGHRCEPYYSRSQCGQCGWQEQWCATCSRQMCGCATETTDQEDQP